MKEVLHMMFDKEESKPYKNGEPLVLNTRGIENVVVQFEPTYKVKKAKVEVIEPSGKVLLTDQRKNKKQKSGKRVTWNPARRAKFMRTMREKRFRKQQMMKGA